MRKKSVLILGGGVAGMSAAMELIERGFDVTVLERQLIPGGKARSMPVFETLQPIDGPYNLKSDFGPKPWVPGEHGFRFFPGFYKHVIDTMERIPLPDGRNVADRLVDTTRITITQFGKPWVSMPARFPRTPHDLQAIVQTVVQAFGPELAMNPDEIAYFVQRIWQIMTSCRERRDGEYERIGWWDFIKADDHSLAYQQLLASGITRSLVAAKAHLASTKTIGDIFVQLILTIVQPHLTSSDRVLDGPTNLAWINPWLKYLTELGVTYLRGYTVEELHCDGQHVTGVTARDFEGNPVRVEADAYLLAVPIERVPGLLNTQVLTADPKLAGLVPLAKNVEWMNGLQYYLKRDVPMEHGHAIHLDTPWALTTISQAQFWPDIDLAQWGDEQSTGVLSVDLSDWNTPGLNGKEARYCTRAEIGAEVWRQLKLSINGDGRQILTDDNLHSWHLDPDIRPNPNKPGEMMNEEPLLVNQVDTWRLRPHATTGIPNLYLASDYVRTYTDLATMEGANEAARRAVNGMLDHFGSSAPRCEIWPLEEPAELAPFWEADRARYEQGLPWDGSVSDAAVEAVSAAQKTGALLPALRAVQAPLGLALIPSDVAMRGPNTLLHAADVTSGTGPDTTSIDFAAIEAPSPQQLIQSGMVPPPAPGEGLEQAVDVGPKAARRVQPSSLDAMPTLAQQLPAQGSHLSDTRLLQGEAPELTQAPGIHSVMGPSGMFSETVGQVEGLASQFMGADVPAGDASAAANPLGFLMNGGVPGGGSLAPYDVLGRATLPSGVPDLWTMAQKEIPSPGSQRGVNAARSAETSAVQTLTGPGASHTQAAESAVRAVESLPEAMGVAPMLEQLGLYRGEASSFLHNAIPSREPQKHLYSLVQEFVGRGGKGLRPGIVLATTEAFGGERKNALPSAAGIELLHNAFLVHDDVQDESEFRRSQPTAHRNVGVPLAINLGDAMQALSMGLFRQNLDTVGPQGGARIMNEVEQMNLRTLEGQAMELGWIRDQRHDITGEDYLEMVLKKTCYYTFTYPMRIGALTAKPDMDVSRFDRLGFLMGAAFQIQDDVLNLVADERYGKEIGGDLYEGKRTLVLIDLLEHADKRDADWVRGFLGQNRKSRLPREVFRLQKMIESYGSLDRTQKVAEELAKEAQAELPRAFGDAPNAGAVSFIRALIGYVVKREI